MKESDGRIKIQHSKGESGHAATINFSNANHKLAGSYICQTNASMANISKPYTNQINNFYLFVEGMYVKDDIFLKKKKNKK